MARPLTRLEGGNRFNLGLFGMNCSGSIATLAPERWKADWSSNKIAAQIADDAGVAFLLPIARWTGYGGATDRQGTSFETLSWASALPWAARVGLWKRSAHSVGATAGPKLCTLHSVGRCLWRSEMIPSSRRLGLVFMSSQRRSQVNPSDAHRFARTRPD